jgi:riboflavin biosynthesis pyrimidine reductase
MRLLIDELFFTDPGTVVPDSSLSSLYFPQALPILRVNMVSTVDGAATGASGLTGSINNPVDKKVFDVLRAMAHVIVVGSGTARAEGYRPAHVPLVLVSRRADVPERLRGAAPGRVLMATCAEAPGLAESRRLLGPDNVMVLGRDRVDLADLRARLVERGFHHILSEGGPHLLRDLLAAGVVEELCMSLVPAVVAGEGPRITAGAALDVRLALGVLLEEDGTLLGRWFTFPPEA